MLITPQYTTGTVPGFAGGPGTGLLETLVDWCTSNSGTAGLDWTIELDQAAKDDDGVTTSYSDTYREVILSNTGMSGQENILIGMREYFYVATNKYGWNLNGYVVLPSTWNGAAPATHGLTGWDSTVKAWSQLPTIQLFNNEMAYWFYSTSEFIFVSVRVGTSYFQCYLGNGARYGSPQEYPYPLVVAGSHRGTESYQNGGYGPVRPSSDNDECSVMVVDPSGSFRRFYTSDDDAEVAILPMVGNSYTDTVGLSPGGSALIMPAIAVTDSYTTCLEYFNVGVFRRFNAQSEQIYVDEEANKWRCFAQGKNDYEYDFLAVFEEGNYSTTTTTTSSTSSTTTTT